MELRLIKKSSYIKSHTVENGVVTFCSNIKSHTVENEVSPSVENGVSLLWKMGLALLWKMGLAPPVENEVSTFGRVQNQRKTSK